MIIKRFHGFSSGNCCMIKILNDEDTVGISEPMQIYTIHITQSIKPCASGALSMQPSPSGASALLLCLPSACIPLP